jgi:hypothetical protein
MQTTACTIPRLIAYIRVEYYVFPTELFGGRIPVYGSESPEGERAGTVLDALQALNLLDDSPFTKDELLDETLRVHEHETSLTGIKPLTREQLE